MMSEARFTFQAFNNNISNLAISNGGRQRANEFGLLANGMGARDKAIAQALVERT